MNLREELLRIREERGKLDPASIVNEWRPEDHPFHDRLEWDDTVAGEAYRVQQAHELIRSVRVVYRTDPKHGPQSVRAFHAVRSDEGHVYESADAIAADPFLARLVLQDMEREWKSMKSRFEHFREFWALVRTDLEQTG